MSTGQETNNVGAAGTGGIVTLRVTLPNPVLANNALLLGVQFNSNGSITSVTDDKGNTWVAGPSHTQVTNQSTISGYYVQGAIAGTRVVTIHFAGIPVNTAPFVSAALSEFYNVAVSGALDKSTSAEDAASPYTAGSMTTTVDGDLIWEYAVSYGTGLTTITAGAGMALLSSDVNSGNLRAGTMCQYGIQATLGAINPSFTADGGETWNMVSMALFAAVAGTAPATTGIRIVGVHHLFLGGTTGPNTSPTPLPCRGNLLVAIFIGFGDVAGHGVVSGITDNKGNVWQSAAADTTLNTTSQILYAQNATTGSDLTTTWTYGPGQVSDFGFATVYDIANAATSAFDVAAHTSGFQAAFGNLSTVSITPSTPHGLVIGCVAIFWHSINGIVDDGHGYVLDTVVNPQDDADSADNGTATSNMDEDNGHGHIYNADSSPLTFVWTAAGPGAIHPGVENWTACAAAFTAPVNPGTLTQIAPNINWPVFLAQKGALEGGRA